MIYVVGQTYLVPIIKVKLNSKSVDLVVLHEHTGDISGEPHQHIDLRFVSEEILKELKQKHLDVLGSESDIFACDVSKTVNKEMVCIRPYSPIKKYTQNQKRDFMILQDMNQHKQMNCNICPHQGCDLSTIPTINNALICPCHGLAWSTITGKMIKRMPNKN